MFILETITFFCGIY